MVVSHLPTASKDVSEVDLIAELVYLLCQIGIASGGQANDDD